MAIFEEAFSPCSSWWTSKCFWRRIIFRMRSSRCGNKNREFITMNRVKKRKWKLTPKKAVFANSLKNRNFVRRFWGCSSWWTWRFYCFILKISESSSRCGNKIDDFITMNSFKNASRNRDFSEFRIFELFFKISKIFIYFQKFRSFSRL